MRLRGYPHSLYPLSAPVCWHEKHANARTKLKPGRGERETAPIGRWRDVEDRNGASACFWSHEEFQGEERSRWAVGRRRDGNALRRSSAEFLRSTIIVLRRRLVSGLPSDESREKSNLAEMPLPSFARPLARRYGVPSLPSYNTLYAVVCCLKCTLKGPSSRSTKKVEIRCPMKLSAALLLLEYGFP